MALSPGRYLLMSHRSFVWLCLLPLAVVTVAFFLLPMVRLVMTGAEGPQGLAGYLAILIEPRYRATLINTVLLAAATTVVTLIVATIAGMFLQRHRFPGRAVLIAMLTFPLAFPGVVVGFLIILLAGRQGLIGEISVNRVLRNGQPGPAGVHEHPVQRPRVESAIAVAPTDVRVDTGEPELHKRLRRCALLVAKSSQREERTTLMNGHGVPAGLDVAGQRQPMPGVDVGPRQPELADDVEQPQESDLLLR